MTIGERVRQERRAAGMTMAELGKKIGVTATSIGRYELGQRKLTVDSLQSIAVALNVSVFELMGMDQ